MAITLFYYTSNNASYYLLPIGHSILPTLSSFAAFLSTALSSEILPAAYICIVDTARWHIASSYTQEAPSEGLSHTKDRYLICSFVQSPIHGSKGNGTLNQKCKAIPISTDSPQSTAISAITIKILSTISKKSTLFLLNLNISSILLFTGAYIARLLL